MKTGLTVLLSILLIAFTIGCNYRGADLAEGKSKITDTTVSHTTTAATTASSKETSKGTPAGVSQEISGSGEDRAAVLDELGKALDEAIKSADALEDVSDSDLNN